MHTPGSSFKIAGTVPPLLAVLKLRLDYLTPERPTRNDKKSPTIAVLFRIAAVVGVSASSLIARAERAMRAEKSSLRTGPKK